MPTDLSIALAAAADARARGLLETAARFDLIAAGLVPPVPWIEVDRETLPDGSQPIRLSRSIRVF